MPDLKKANSLLKELALKNKCISPVTLADIDLFNKFFKEEKEHTYGNTWTYVTQGMYGLGPNNLGYKYYDGKNLSILGIYPRVEQPDINICYWVRPMGETILDVIVSVGKDLAKNLGVPTYTKKLYQRQAEYLFTKGFKNTQEFPWHTEAPQEDDTYPELIYECQATYQSAQTLPRKYHLKKSYIRTKQIEDNYVVEVTDRDFEKYAWNIANDFFKAELIRKDKTVLSNANDYFNMTYNNPVSPTLGRAIIYVNKVPLGFFVTDISKDDDNYTNVYGLIIMRNKLKYLAEYTLLHLLSNAKTKYLNLGGSEDVGLHEFKKKYIPIREQKMFWMTNGPLAF